MEGGSIKERKRNLGGGCMSSNVSVMCWWWWCSSLTTLTLHSRCLTSRQCYAKCWITHDKVKPRTHAVDPAALPHAATLSWRHDIFCKNPMKFHIKKQKHTTNTWILYLHVPSQAFLWALHVFWTWQEALQVKNYYWNDCKTVELILNKWYMKYNFPNVADLDLIC